MRNQLAEMLPLPWGTEAIHHSQCKPLGTRAIACMRVWSV